MSLFKFKQFSVCQSRSAMKVGTDGVLLGAWVDIRGDENRILDIGTGTALIAIMMAQRSSACNIVGVEIDMESAQQAHENMMESQWADRLRVEGCAIQTFESDTKFDLILSNPPYFVNSLLAKGESRTIARHTTALSFDDLVAAVARLLSPSGRFAVILPPSETEHFDVMARGVLSLRRRCRVKGKVGGVVRRVMSEYSLGEDGEVEESELAVRAPAPEEYTAEYMALTAEFYLKF
ncbi:MAG: methyltransferase [Rikenellaceae bacterium]